MSEKLRIALVNKEKADTYLSNLETLKEDNHIEEVQYNVLKTEYAKLRNDAVLRINAAKLEIKRILDAKLKELAAAKTEYKYLEIRHKVGQIPVEVYSKQEINPKKRIADLEKTVGDLQRLYNARTSSEVSAETGARLFGFSLGKKKAEEPPDLVIELPPPPPEKKPEPEKLEPVAEQIPVVEVPPPAPLPPQIVLPPPPPPTISVQQIEKPTPPKSEEEKLAEQAAAEKGRRGLPEGLVLANLQILPDRVVSGNHVGIVVSLRNVGKQPVNHRMDLKINGVTKDAAIISLEAGKNDEITFLVTAETPGDYTIDLDGREGKFVVIP
ncbi:MAG: hypothetical protein A2Z02_00755 [Chloroflexi bacterium RBG_16_48_7]|nr:MAG: hypothetical protein A2Z02_00755 [Chloroflexi bacterium RBG_16_48_7]